MANQIHSFLYCNIFPCIKGWVFILDAYLFYYILVNSTLSTELLLLINLAAARVRGLVYKYPLSICSRSPSGPMASQLDTQIGQC